MRASVFCSFARVLVVGLFCGLAAPAFATEQVKSMFADENLEPFSGTFLVARKGVNYRDGPRTDAKRLGTLETGSVVTVVGKAKGSDWYAVVMDGKELGYAFGPVFVRLIDGSLANPLKGSAKGGGGVECRYAIRFEGENRVEEENMITADYSVEMDCKQGGKNIKFAAFMFMTEVPFDLSTKSGYQINVEVNEISGDYEEPLIATAIYHYGKGEVIGEGVTPKQFASSAVGAKRSVVGVSEALRASVEMAVASWNDKVWTALFRPSR
ncbi:MAG: SH3 domain-containing protein [Rhodospirillales bacterium]|nr:SH3 domain-containing protein [Rhodospirillales bacterium]